MKIKTIAYALDTPGLKDFDDGVNAAMAEGWRLAKRETLPGVALGNAYFEPHLYAELVLPDPAPEPEQGDPVEALRCIRDFCKSMPLEKCLTPECPLFSWCHVFTEDGVSPSDWPIPGEEAGQ